MSRSQIEFQLKPSNRYPRSHSRFAATYVGSKGTHYRLRARAFVAGYADADSGSDHDLDPELEGVTVNRKQTDVEVEQC
jgi:hypothetical protein